MNESAFAKICLFVAVFAIVALAVLPIGLGVDGTVDPFRGASQMPGDPANTWSPSH